jgi:hypothetical protein
MPRRRRPSALALQLVVSSSPPHTASRGPSTSRSTPPAGRLPGVEASRGHRSALHVTHYEFLEFLLKLLFLLRWGGGISEVRLCLFRLVLAPQEFHGTLKPPVPIVADSTGLDSVLDACSGLLAAGPRVPLKGPSALMANACLYLRM